MFSFTPYSDEQLQKIRIGFTEGPAEFNVIFADNHRSQKGSSLKLELWVRDAEGNEGKLLDFLSTSEKMCWKIKHFFQAIGEMPAYESGAIYPSQLKDKKGKCLLKIQKGNNGYADKMAVQDYLDPNEAQKTDDFFEDDIPFP